jgi:hypothetical protein
MLTITPIRDRGSKAARRIKLKDMPMPSNHLKDHIAIIAKHEEEFLGARTTPERVADLLGAFVGSLVFIAIHVLVGQAKAAIRGHLKTGHREKP